MSHRTVLLLCAIGLVFTTETLQADELDKLLDRWRFDTPSADEIETIPPDKVLQIVERLKSWDDPSQPVRQEKAWALLIQLGDRETGQMVAEELADNQQNSSTGYRAAVSILQRTTQPWVILMLEPVLLIDEPSDGPASGGVVQWPRSTIAAGMIHQILLKSPAFDPGIARSASNLPVSVHSAEPARSLIRQWWLENKEHFEHEAYQAVTPIRLPEEEDSTNAVSDTSGCSAKSNPEAAPKPTPAAATAIDISAPAFSWHPLLLATVILLILGGIAVALRRRSR